MASGSGSERQIDMPFTHVEYGEICRQGNASSRQEINEGWQRWQRWHEMRIDQRAAGMLVHPTGMPAPEPRDDDHWIFAATGPLYALMRASTALLPTMADKWGEFEGAHGNAMPGTNARSRARGFVHYTLISGRAVDPEGAGQTASAIVWLLSTGLQVNLGDKHLFGYDITCVPGPPGQKTMFNFRAMLHPDPPRPGEDWLAFLRAGPTPEWQSPPH